jgi:hypothetical protein
VNLNKILKLTLPIRRPRFFAGLAIALGGAFAWPNVGSAFDDVPAARTTAQVSEADIQFRGGDHAAVDRRFTLEILVVNPSSSPLTNVDLLVQFDDGLELSSKSAEHRATIDSIPANDLHIVRLPVMPKKSGPAGVDVTLRDRDGGKQQLRFVLPIGSTDAPLPKTEENRPLQIKFSSLKALYADQPSVVLMSVLNTDGKAMPDAIKITVNYGRIAMPFATPIDVRSVAIPGAAAFGRRGEFEVTPNPTRQTTATIPALQSGESVTIPLRITPRRVGDLTFSVLAEKTQANQMATLATAQLNVSFDPNLSTDRLLPTRAGATIPKSLPTTLADVPEVSIEDDHSAKLPAGEAFEHVAHLIEKINHVNKNKTDAYMEALIKHRTDVRGLPFAMGDSCRLTAEESRLFKAELERLRPAMANPAAMAQNLPNASATNEPIWMVKARIAALVQVVEPEGPELGRQMVKYLASLSHIDATRALARIAISAEDDEMRSKAVDALAVRRDADYDEILINGLNYPFPAVAERSKDAIVKMKRLDLAPKLVAMLDRPDPRAPQTKEIDGKTVPVVRELVRVNHLKNCLLCHSPAKVESLAAMGLPPGPIKGDSKSGDASIAPRSGPVAVQTALVAPIPLPGQPVPTLSQGGYGQSSLTDTLVAFDVTYLRQDFSVKLPVANAQPWPDRQRFDFLVRTRQLTEKDAEAYRELVCPAAGELTPYQRIAVAGLRQLTGRDAGANANAWQRILAEMRSVSASN